MPGQVTCPVQGLRPHRSPVVVSCALTADIHDPAATAAALAGQQFDVVVNWVAYVPDDVARDLALFGSRVKQYVFISSASAYQKPPATYRITESTPLSNPYWTYSR